MYMCTCHNHGTIFSIAALSMAAQLVLEEDLAAQNPKLRSASGKFFGPDAEKDPHDNRIFCCSLTGAIKSGCYHEEAESLDIVCRTFLDTSGHSIPAKTSTKHKTKAEKFDQYDASCLDLVEPFSLTRYLSDWGIRKDTRPWRSGVRSL